MVENQTYGYQVSSKHVVNVSTPVFFHAYYSPRLTIRALSAAAADLAAGSNRRSPLSRAPHHGVEYITQCDVLAPPAHANYASAESSIYAGKVCESCRPMPDCAW